MSAPLVLSAADLHNLANGLDAMTRARRSFGVGPGEYDPSISINVTGDVINLRVRWHIDTETETGEYVIDDRYGS
jgi:hypothetical protein